MKPITIDPEWKRNLEKLIRDNPSHGRVIIDSLERASLLANEGNGEYRSFLERAQNHADNINADISIAASNLDEDFAAALMSDPLQLYLFERGFGNNSPSALTDKNDSPNYLHINRIVEQVPQDPTRHIQKLLPYFGPEESKDAAAETTTSPLEKDADPKPYVSALSNNAKGAIRSELSGQDYSGSDNKEGIFRRLFSRRNRGADNQGTDNITGPHILEPADSDQDYVGGGQPISNTGPTERMYAGDVNVPSGNARLVRRNKKQSTLELHKMVDDDGNTRNFEFGQYAFDYDKDDEKNSKPDKPEINYNQRVFRKSWEDKRGLEKAEAKETAEREQNNYKNRSQESFFVGNSDDFRDFEAEKKGNDLSLDTIVDPKTENTRILTSKELSDLAKEADGDSRYVSSPDDFDVARQYINSDDNKVKKPNGKAKYSFADRLQDTHDLYAKNVSEGKSNPVTKTAEDLGVSPSTVNRRLDRIKEATGEDIREKYAPKEDSNEIKDKFQGNYRDFIPKFADTDKNEIDYRALQTRNIESTGTTLKAISVLYQHKMFNEGKYETALQIEAAQKVGDRLQQTFDHLFDSTGYLRKDSNGFHLTENQAARDLGFAKETIDKRISQLNDLLGSDLSFEKKKNLPNSNYKMAA